MTYGDDYQRLSKYARESLQGKRLDFSKQPALYKIYPERFAKFFLPEPQKEAGAPLYSLLKKRRSERSFEKTPVSAAALSQILWATQGITLKTPYHEFRAAPSAGGLYPLETYLVLNRVEDFKPGVYHYQVPTHSLVLLKEGPFGEKLARIALDQSMTANAAFTFIWSAVVERSKWKYGERAYRYIYLDAGHMAQNAALTALSLELGSCPIGAFFDSEADELLGLDGKDEFSVYMTAIGKPKKDR